MAYTDTHRPCIAGIGDPDMTDIATLPDALRDALPVGVDPARCEITTLGALARAHEIASSYSDLPEDAPVVILPGFVADDGNAEVKYPAAETAEEAAHSYVDDGSWGEIDETTWVHVHTWRVAYAYDPDAEDAVKLVINHERHRVAIEPQEPDCTADEHDWQLPHEVLGGLKENPGVWGHGGGVIIKEVCAHCGRYRIWDTWAQDPETGEQGLESVRYEEADETSLDWIAERSR